MFAREEPTGVRVWILGVAGSGSPHLQQILFIGLRFAAAGGRVGQPEEDFRRQVPAKFATEGALKGDGLKGKFPDAAWHVTAASLAGDHEGLAG